MATNVLDRLEELLAAATPGPWVVDTIDDSHAFWKVVAGCREVFDDGSACGEYSPACSHEDRDALIALRNAAPALIRLARGAMEMVGCAERCEKGEDISQAQVDAMGAEIESAAKALGEVRL